MALTTAYSVFGLAVVGLMAFSAAQNLESTNWSALAIGLVPRMTIRNPRALASAGSTGAPVGGGGGGAASPSPMGIPPGMPGAPGMAICGRLVSVAYFLKSASDPVTSCPRFGTYRDWM